MNGGEFDSYLQVAEAAAQRAGNLLLDYSRNLATAAIDYKSSHVDLVSTADREAEALISEELLSATPDFGFIGEESVQEEPAALPELSWVVDPLDGTSNYLSGLPIWSVSIALCRRNDLDFKPLVGVVLSPPLNRLWSAAVGRGTTLNGAPVRVRAEPAGGGLHNAMIATGFPYSVSADDSRSNLANFSRMQRRFHKIRRLGSAAIDLAFIADGTYDGMWELGLKLWDISAGRLLITEAGGKFEMLIGGGARPDVHILAAASGELLADMRGLLEFPPST